MPWKTSTKASNGLSYRFFKQMKQAECGPAAVATVGFHIHNEQPRITDVSEYFKEGESVDHVTRNGIRDFVNAGSWKNGTIAALKKLKIEGVPHKNPKYFAKYLFGVSKSTPAIVSVGWYETLSNSKLKRNGGHWIVALATTKHSVICLDPDLDRPPKKVGIQEIPKPLLTKAKNNGENPEYKVDYGFGQLGYRDKKTNNFIPLKGMIDLIITCQEAEHELPQFQEAYI